MKRTIGIVFLSVILMQVAGSYFYFIVRLHSIRKEMREELKYKPDEDLTLLTLTAEEYRHAKPDEFEIEVHGKMYDIARTVLQDGQVLVYALHDEAEDNLLALLNEMVKRSSKDKKPVPSQLIQLLTLQFVNFDYKIPSLAGISFVHTTPYHSSFSSFIRGIESPPPRD